MGTKKPTIRETTERMRAEWERFFVRFENADVVKLTRLLQVFDQVNGNVTDILGRFFLIERDMSRMAEALEGVKHRFDTIDSLLASKPRRRWQSSASARRLAKEYGVMPVKGKRR